MFPEMDSLDPNGARRSRTSSEVSSLHHHAKSKDALSERSAEVDPHERVDGVKIQWQGGEGIFPRPYS